MVEVICCIWSVITPAEPKEESTIEFSEVSAYHFIHTGPAIITEIDEVSLVDLLHRWGSRLSSWCRQHGGNQLWDEDSAKYRSDLEREGYKAWSIESAIGFEGFVIAKAVTQRETT